MNKKKILIITPGYCPITRDSGGAIEKMVRIYLDHSENKNNDEIVVYSAHTRKYQEKNIFKNIEVRSINLSSIRYKIENFFHRVYSKLLPRKYGRLYIKKVVEDLARRKEQEYYDVIIIENNILEILYFTKNIKSKIKTVLHLHNDILNNETKNARAILKSLDEVWCVSKFIKGQVVEIDKTMEDKVLVLYNTLDVKITQINEERRNRLREKHNIPLDSFVFLYTGRVMPEKGASELVEAFLMLKTDRKINLLIVGGGKSLHESDKYYKEIKRRCKMDDRIIMTGLVNRDELVDYYSIADAQIIPSKWNEPFGLVALEGLAFCLPVIYTNIGGLPEVIPLKALRLKKVTPREICEKMEAVLENPSTFILKDEDRKNVLRRFSKDNYIDALNRLIEKNVMGDK